MLTERTPGAWVRRPYLPLAIAFMSAVVATVLADGNPCGDECYFPVNPDGETGGTCIKIVVGNDPDTWTCGWLFGDPDPCDGDYTLEEQDGVCLNPGQGYECLGSGGDDVGGFKYVYDNNCERIQWEDGTFSCVCYLDLKDIDDITVKDCTDCPSDS